LTQETKAQNALDDGASTLGSSSSMLARRHICILCLHEYSYFMPQGAALTNPFRHFKLADSLSMFRRTCSPHVIGSHLTQETRALNALDEWRAIDLLWPCGEVDPAPWRAAAVTGAVLPTLSHKVLTEKMGLTNLLANKALREIGGLLARADERSRNAAAAAPATAAAAAAAAAAADDADAATEEAGAGTKWWALTIPNIVGLVAALALAYNLGLVGHSLWRRYHPHTGAVSDTQSCAAAAAAAATAAAAPYAACAAAPAPGKPEVGPCRHCPPRNPPHFQPAFVELHGIL